MYYAFVLTTTSHYIIVIYKPHKMWSSLLLRKQFYRNYERGAKTFVILTYFNANLQQPRGFGWGMFRPLELPVLW